jgi:WD repeat-containing protein 61
MENWKVEFVEDAIMTGGDNGKINFYNSVSKEKVRKVDTGDIFLTALGKADQKDFIAAGNNNGGVFIVSKGSNNKSNVLGLSPHNKLVRELVFIEDDSKLLSASDDGTIGMIDISSEKVIQHFEGHKLAVSSVSPHQNDQRIFFSSSFDKTVKIWDLRTKACVGTGVTGSPLWDCRSIGKNLLVGGENGLLILYSVE